IVDVMRNDIGRVCEYGSVRAPTLVRAEAHPGVWHLVSDVEGVLRPGVGDGELLRATFPPASVTGAPKVRAMELIAALEATGREAADARRVVAGDLRVADQDEKTAPRRDGRQRAQPAVAHLLGGPRLIAEVVGPVDPRPHERHLGER